MPPIRKLFALAFLAVCLSGCRHYAGWADRRVRRAPVSTETRVEFVQASDPVRVIQTPSPTRGTIVLKAVGKEVARRFERREIIGRRAYIPYRWYTPLWKPLVAVTIVGPFYLPCVDPHNHSGKNWRKLDYARDVVGYFNLFEAYPYGPREIERDWRVIASDESWTPTREVEAPLAGARVKLRLGDRTLAETATGAEGTASFDLTPLVTATMAAESQRFSILLMPDDRQDGAVQELPVEAEVLRALLDLKP